MGCEQNIAKVTVLKLNFFAILSKTLEVGYMKTYIK